MTFRFLLSVCVQEKRMSVLDWILRPSSILLISSWSLKYVYSITVRLCLPFPCVSTPIYGPSCFLSLVNSSPSVFDLLLTWCCFPWLCYVFISPEFSLSLCPSTRLCSCVSCVPSLKSHYSFYLSSPVSFPQHDCDRLTDPKERWRSAAAARSWSWSAVCGGPSTP